MERRISRTYPGSVKLNLVVIGGFNGDNYQLFSVKWRQPFGGSVDSEGAEIVQGGNENTCSLNHKVLK